MDELFAAPLARQEDIVLLDSRDGRMPITCDGEIELSRNVVTVELRGELIFHVVASQVRDKSDVVAESKAFFTLVILASVRWKLLLPRPSLQPWRTCALVSVC